jgi:hypothetical protein
MRVLCLVLAFAAAIGCGGNRQEVIEPGPPPLPPASGSVIGFLIDAKHDLVLTAEQLAKLEQIDDSLAAQNGSLDAQIRQIERPVPAEELSPQQQKAGEKEPRYNNAPGASTIVTEDSLKLRKMRDANDREAIEKALALLDAEQAPKARRILEERGVSVPGAASPSPPPE